MGKFRRGKILVFAFLMIVSFFAFTGKASATWDACQKWNEDIEDFVSEVQVHLYLDGVEIEPDQLSTNTTDKYIGSSVTHNVRTGEEWCNGFTLPDSALDKGFGWNNRFSTITTEDGTRGILAWYDNPEFEGEPVSFINKEKDDTTSEYWFYGKTAPLITIYVNGRERRVVVGRDYSPYMMDSEYYIRHGRKVESYNVISEGNNDNKEIGFEDDEHEFFQTGGKYGVVDDQYYRDLSEPVDEDIIAVEPTHVSNDNSFYLPYINYDSCKRGDDGWTSYYSCLIDDPVTGEAIQPDDPRIFLWAYVGVQRTDSLGKFFRITGFIDEKGNEYGTVINMKPEYDGKSFTTLVDDRQTCTDSQVQFNELAIYQVQQIYGSRIN